MAVTMRFAQKVRRQKILKIFLPECPCRSVKSCYAVARANSRVSKRNVFCPDELSYGELSAPMRYNLFIEPLLSPHYTQFGCIGVVFMAWFFIQS